MFINVLTSDRMTYHLYSVKPRPPGTNCLLLNMKSTNETLLFDRFLIMYNLCVFTCIIVMFVFYCTHVPMSYVCHMLLTHFPVVKVTALDQFEFHLW